MTPLDGREGRPRLLAAGVGRLNWGGGLVHQDGRHLLWFDGTTWHGTPCPGMPDVWPLTDGFVVEARPRWAVRSGKRSGAPPSPFSSDGEWLFRRHSGATEPIGPAATGLVHGPGGAFIGADRCAAPDGSVRRLPASLTDIVWAEDGRTAWAKDADQGVQVDLSTGTTTPAERPLGWGRRFDGRAVVVADGSSIEGLCGGGHAWVSPWLWGPGGARWDLRSGARVSPISGTARRVEDRVVTWDGATLMAWSPDGTRLAQRGAPPGDFTDFVLGQDGPTLVGEACAVAVGPDLALVAVDPPNLDRVRRREWGSTEEARVGDTRWGWNDEGRLLAF